MHEAPPAKHFKSSACWPRYILSWTFLVDFYIGHWNFNIFAPTGWLLRLFYNLDPFEICSDVKPREGKPVFRSVLVLSWFSQEHSFLAQWRKPYMPWLCLGAPLSVVHWYDMVGLVWVTVRKILPYHTLTLIPLPLVHCLVWLSRVRSNPTAHFCAMPTFNRVHSCAGPSPSGHPAKIWIGV